MKKYILIIGAGLFGLTCAVKLKKKGYNPIIIEKRNSIGGNCATKFINNIEIHKYGSHIFHTNSKTVWDFVNNYTAFTNYKHTVKTIYNNKIYPMPISLKTINQFFNTNFNEEECKKFLLQKAIKLNHKPANFKEQIESQIGTELYKAFFEGYTYKQWNIDPKLLSVSIAKRIPIRYTQDDSYFNAKEQGMPSNGFNSWFKNMAKDINILYNCNFNNPNSYFNKFNTKGKYPTIYTGQIDNYFDFTYGTLGWRSLKFKTEILNKKNFQNTTVINYANLKIPYTRIHEFKYYHPENQKVIQANKTAIMYEYPTDYIKNKTDAFYPINSNKDIQVLDQYIKLAKKEKNNNIFFGGRLGLYKYMDMDTTIKTAINFIENNF
jgi:UDP-galactopyranose mutase